MPVSSFIGSILSSKDNPGLIIGALQIVEMLLSKLPTQYRASFRREGVLHEIEIRGAQELTTAKAAKAPTPAVTPSPAPEPEAGSLPGDGNTQPPMTAEPVPLPTSMLGDHVPPPSILSTILPPPAKRSSSSSIDPQDAIILRCRVVKFKYLNVSSGSQGDDSFETLQALGRRVAYAQASEVEIRRTLGEVAALFVGGAVGSFPVSSFELMKSGLVDELLEFTTAEGRKGRNLFVAR